jgi:hypothetical protein
MMAHDIKLTSDKGSMQERLNARLQNSGSGARPDVTVKHGEGARRTFHNIHHGSTQHMKQKNDQGGGER